MKVMRRGEESLPAHSGPGSEFYVCLPRTIDGEGEEGEGDRGEEIRSTWYDGMIKKQTTDGNNRVLTKNKV